MDAVKAKSSGSYVKFIHTFWRNLSNIAPVQQPHCPSMQEHGNLGTGKKGRFVVVVVLFIANVDDTALSADSVTFSSATIPKKQRSPRVYRPNNGNRRSKLPFDSHTKANNTVVTRYVLYLFLAIALIVLR